MSKNYLSYKHTYFGMSNSFTKNYNIDEKIIKLELYQNIILIIQNSLITGFFAKILYENRVFENRVFENRALKIKFV